MDKNILNIKCLSIMIVMCNKQINNTQETSAVEFMERFKAIQRKDVASKHFLITFMLVIYQCMVL